MLLGAVDVALADRSGRRPRPVVGNLDPQHGLEENEFGDIFDPDPVKRRDPFSRQSAAPDDAAIIFGVLEKDVQRDLKRAAVLASENFRDTAVCS